MKKKLLVGVLMLTMALATFAGGKEGVSERIINAFKQEFTDARDVQWEISKEFAKATFKMQEQVMFAYYSQEGKLLALTRNITSSQLPIHLLSAVKKSYNDYWITDLFEMVVDNDTTYYITLESGDQEIILKSGGASGWQVYKKERKI